MFTYIYIYIYIYIFDAFVFLFFSRFLCMHVIDNAEFVGMPFVLSEMRKRLY